MNRTPSGRWFLPSILAVAVFLRLFRLGYQSLWIDELLTLDMARAKPGYSVGAVMLYNIHGPLHAFAVYLARQLGHGDAWLRLPSAVAGIGAVWVFYAWVRRWLGEGVARVATVLVAFDPLLVYYSQEIRNYSFVLFFGLLSCYLFDRLTRSPGPRGAVAYALAMAAAALSNFSAAFLFAAHTVIYAGRSGFSWSSVRRWALVALVILVVISPWVYRIWKDIDVSRLVTPVTTGELTTEQRLRGDTTVSWAVVPYTFYAFSAGFSLGPSLGELHRESGVRAVLSHYAAAVSWVAVLFGALFLVGVRALRGRRAQAWELAVYLVFPIVFTLVLGWQNAKAFNVRYVLLAFPAYACILALGIHSLPRRAAAVALGLCVVTMGGSLWNYYFVGRYAREDVKRATRYVEARLGTGECIVAPTVWQIVGHYYHGSATVYPIFNSRGTPRSYLDAQLEKVFAACNSTWYLRARPWASDPDDYIWNRLESHYAIVEQAEFDGVKVFHLKSRNPGDDRG